MMGTQPLAYDCFKMDRMCKTPYRDCTPKQKVACVAKSDLKIKCNLVSIIVVMVIVLPFPTLMYLFGTPGMSTDTVGTIAIISVSMSFFLFFPVYTIHIQLRKKDPDWKASRERFQREIYVQEQRDILDGAYYVEGPGGFLDEGGGVERRTRR